MKPAFILPLLAMLFCASSPAADWQSATPREELRPGFERKGELLSIDATGRNDATGQWQKLFAIEGGGAIWFLRVRQE